MSSDSSAPAAPAGPADGGGRRTDPGTHDAERAGLSAAGQIATAAGLIGGVAGAGVLWHKQVTDAIFGRDEAGAQAPAPEAAPAAAAPPPPVAVDDGDDSMDAFDAPSPSRGGGRAGGAGQSAGNSGDPSAGQVATPGISGGQASTSSSALPDRPTTPARADPPAGPARPNPTTGISTQDIIATPVPTADPVPSGSRPDPRVPDPVADTSAPTPAPAPAAPAPDVQVNQAFEATRSTLAANLAAWEAPEGADPAEAAALRDRLAALIDRFQPGLGQAAEDAVAELRDEVDLHIDNYLQGERIDALIEAQKADDAAEAAEAAEAAAPPLVMTAPAPDIKDTIRPQLVDVFDEDAGIAPAASTGPSGFPAGGGPKVAPMDPTMVDPITGEGMGPVGPSDTPPLISLTDDALGLDQVTADVAASAAVDPVLNAPIPGSDDDGGTDPGADLDPDPGAATDPDDDTWAIPSDDPLEVDPLDVDLGDPLSSGDFGDDVDDSGYQAPDDVTDG